MSATLQPGAVCASLDNGQLFIVESIGADVAHVRPIDHQAPAPAVLLAALAALVRDLEKHAPKLGPLRSIADARRLVAAGPVPMAIDDLWPLLDRMP